MKAAVKDTRAQPLHPRSGGYRGWITCQRCRWV